MKVPELHWYMFFPSPTHISLLFSYSSKQKAEKPGPCCIELPEDIASHDTHAKLVEVPKVQRRAIAEDKGLFLPYLPFRLKPTLIKNFKFFY